MEKKWEKIVIGILIIFLASKYQIIMNLLSGSPLLSETEIKLLSIPWGIRVIFWCIGFWFIFGKAIGYLTIIAGIIVALAIGITGIGALVGVGIVVIGILMLIIG